MSFSGFSVKTRLQNPPKNFGRLNVSPPTDGAPGAVVVRGAMY
jgi:hypothetical protein